MGIASIQRGVSLTPNGGQYGVVTISSVNTAKTQVHRLGSVNNANNRAAKVYCYLASSTELWISNQYNSTSYISWEVIEFT